VTADVLSIPKLLLAPRFSEVARKQELLPNRFNDYYVKPLKRLTLV
jgi:hypothetical protein